MNQRQHLIRLRDMLVNRLSEDELRSLCFDLGVDYENLGGETKAAHARNLIGHFERRGRLSELVAACQSALPDLPWSDLDTGQPAGSASTPAPPRISRPVKILFLAANPADTPPLRLDAEIRAIDESLRRAEYRQRFELEQQWAVRVGDLQACLLRHRPDIVHFSGHGSTESEIVLEDALGHSQVVPARALSALFALLKDNLRCVVLNACYTEIQAAAIAEHIDCVIGMHQAIGDDAALSFVAAFYQALGYGRDVQKAFELGRNAIDLQSLADADMPRLLSPHADPRQISFVK